MGIFSIIKKERERERNAISTCERESTIRLHISWTNLDQFITVYDRGIRGLKF